MDPGVAQPPETDMSSEQPTYKEDPATVLHREGALLYTNYTNGLDRGNPPDAIRPYLQRAINSYTQALAQAPPGHSRRFIVMLDLVFALLEDNPNTLSGLQRIEDLFDELCHADADLKRLQGSEITYNLGRLYSELYVEANIWERDEVIFERAVSHYRASVDYSDVVLNRVDALLKVAKLHYDRNQDLHYQKALEVAEEARRLCPENMTEPRYNISKALFEMRKARFNQRGRKEDLENAIAECAKMLYRTPESAEHKRREVLSELVHCIQIMLDVHGCNPQHATLQIGVGPLHEAFKWWRDIENSDGAALEATRMLADVLAHPKRNPTTDDLEKAITLYRKVVRRRPNDRALLRKTADTIWLRCTSTSNFSQFEEVVGLYERALSALEIDEPANDSSISETIELANNVATFYLRRSGIHGKGREWKKRQVEDLKRAHLYYSKAEQLCATSDPGQASWFRGELTKIDFNMNLLKGSLQKGGDSDRIVLQDRVGPHSGSQRRGRI